MKASQRVWGFSFRFSQKSGILGILDPETGKISKAFPASSRSFFPGVPSEKINKNKYFSSENIQPWRREREGGLFCRALLTFAGI